ncbi:pyridoxal phosphate-dependent aminotransferase [Roseicyclus sp. F158]|uniref:aspartate transaminase n=1 Tax=Tropicimonas omnivorans TaxID=3075590 RepID=A0ABU3DD30_9RHOB|nr:pyridoxal phosphate-dependent aminotransferase [Roseicyclus sp. F158]MDT0681621.1 pyridoxal phosphate-dependent aminotransferase [Roseicyclus sp. F158]
MKQLAKRITETSPKSFGMFAKAMQTGREGLIHLELGRPSADTPEHIKEATIDALRRGDVHYSDLQGVPHLRRALAEKLARKNDLDVTPDRILVTNGLTHGSYAGIMAFLDPGDEAILLEPYYPQHIGKVELAGATPVLAQLDASKNYAIDPEAIEAKITERTKMIVLINPCNPTGRVYSREELQALADIAIKHDLIVMSDEVYEDILFDKAEHISIASLPGMDERTITLFAFTKSYAMDGWRLGYLVAPEAAMSALLKITTNDCTHVNTFIQDGALAAVTGDPDVLQGLIDEDAEKRQRVVSRLNQMPGITCPWPEGTIYAFADISGTGFTSQGFADKLLEEAGVVVEAGSFYGAAGEGRVRVCFGSASIEDIDLAMDRIQAMVSDRVPA